ncbi:MAG: hypothetical protein ACLGGX_09070 [Bdellovibrionia bacterium]
MDDGPSSKNKSFLDSLKTEWSLLWSNLVDEEPKVAPVNEKDLASKVKKLSAEQVRQLSKGLSLERKHLNMKLESTQKELELCHAKCESMKVVGADTTEMRERIESLTDQGVALSEALQKLDEQIRVIRNREQELNNFRLNNFDSVRST